MAKTLQFRRDTAENLANTIGAQGELFVDTTTDTVVVMDGSSAGGNRLASENWVESGDYTFEQVVTNNIITPLDYYGNDTPLLVNGKNPFGFASAVATGLIPSGDNFGAGGDGTTVSVPGDIRGTLSSGMEIRFGGITGGEYHINQVIFDSMYNSSYITITPALTDHVGGQEIYIEEEGIVEIYAGSGLSTQVITESHSGEKVLVLSTTGAGGSGSFNQQLNTTDSVEFAGLNILSDTRSSQTFTYSSINGDFDFAYYNFYPWDTYINFYGSYNQYKKFLKFKSGDTFHFTWNDPYGQFKYDVQAKVTGVIDSGFMAHVTFDPNNTNYTRYDRTNNSVQGSGNNVGSAIWYSGYTWNYYGPNDNYYLSVIDVVNSGALYNPLTTSNNTVQITDLIADTALIGNIGIIDNTISPTSTYGTGGTLTVDGDLEVTGKLLNDAVLTVNVDGSKSVDVNTIKLTDYKWASWMNQTGNGITWNGSARWYSPNYPNYIFANKILIEQPNAFLIRILSSLKIGDKFSFFPDNGAGTKGTKITVTLTSEVTSSFSGYIFSIAENFANYSNGSFIDFYKSYIEYDQTTALTIQNGSLFKSVFDTTGGLTVKDVSADTIVVDSALIGTMALMENTISPTDAYGTGGTLTVDGNLEITGSNLTSPKALDVVVGEGIKNYVTANENGMYSFDYTASLGIPQIKFPQGISDNLKTLLLSLPIGATLSWFDNMYYVTRTVTITSKFTYQSMNMQYVANVAENNPNESTSSGLNGITITYGTPKVTYEFGTDGSLTLPSTTDTPNNTSTVVKWAKIKVGGQLYYMPLYQ